VPNTKISGLDRMRMARDQRENELVLPLQSGLLAARNELHSTRYQLATLQAALKKIEHVMSMELMKRLADHMAHRMVQPILRTVLDACMNARDRNAMVTAQFRIDDVIWQDDRGKVRQVLDRWLSEKQVEASFSVDALGVEAGQAVEVVRTRVSLPSINFNHDELVKPKRRSVA
jgi:hypothetical protein